MKVENEDRTISDFAALFNYFWYRDFPLSKDYHTEGSPAEWTTHILFCIKACADLMGYFTLFEYGKRTDALVRNNKKEVVAHVESEWSPITYVGSGRVNSKVNDVRKLFKKRDKAILSVFISFSRSKGCDRNLEIIKSQWHGSKDPLLVFFVTYSHSTREGKAVRDFQTLETYLFQNAKMKKVRTQPALPWEATGTRWESNK